MNIDPIIVHGWKFEFTDSRLIINSEDGSHQVDLNARAAYSLLDYLYQHRDDVHDAAAQQEEVQTLQSKAEPGSETDVAQSE